MTMNLNEVKKAEQVHYQIYPLSIRFHSLYML
jgi:hypothetical protein